jgi:hypothetical protein
VDPVDPVVGQVGPVVVVREAADRVDRMVDQADRVEVVRGAVDRVDLGVAHQGEVAAVVGKQVRLKGGLLLAIEVLVAQVLRVDQAVRGEDQVDLRVGEW